MKKNQVKIVIEGLPEDQGLVRVNALAEELSAINSAINQIDRIATGKKYPTFYLRITEMSYKSPMTVMIEPVNVSQEIDRRAQTLLDFSRLINSVADGSISTRKIDTRILNQMQNIGSAVGKKFSAVTISTNGNQLNIDDKYQNRMKKALAPEETISGYIEGFLDYINIHEEINVFRIYPTVGPTKVKCHFPKNLKEKAISGVGNQVCVYGNLKIKSISKHPHEIEAEEIDIYPPEEELPGLDELWGIAPNLTEGLEPLEYLRKVRNE